MNNFIRFHKCEFIELYFNENQERKTRPQVINVNGDKPVFFPFSIEITKCSGSCNNINYHMDINNNIKYRTQKCVFLML